ncbi:hypothetical protein CMEL01_05667, partial [Colletotrichum melonis]
FLPAAESFGTRRCAAAYLSVDHSNWGRFQKLRRVFFWNVNAHGLGLPSIPSLPVVRNHPFRWIEALMDMFI